MPGEPEVSLANALMKVRPKCSGHRRKEQDDGAHPMQRRALDKGGEGSWEVGKTRLRGWLARYLRSLILQMFSVMKVLPEVPLGTAAWAEWGELCILR